MMAVAEKILIVDPEHLVRSALRQECEEWGYEVLEADCGRVGLRFAQSSSPDLVLLAFCLPDIASLEVLGHMLNGGYTRAVIVMGGQPRLEDLRAIFDSGAYDFVSEPADFEKFRMAIEDAIRRSRWETEPRAANRQADINSKGYPVVASSLQAKELLSFVRRIASSEATPVLIRGESGTGKNLIARLIHRESKRSRKDFVAIDCSALSERLLEAELFGHTGDSSEGAENMNNRLLDMAEQGTIFLKGIESLSPLLQAKLQRVLEHPPVWNSAGPFRERIANMRILAACESDLEEAVLQGQFRQDLYYELSTFEIFVPPLRDRKDDILPLTELFLQQCNQKFNKSVRGLADKTRHVLLDHSWPGNVRELKNAIRRAMLLEDESLLRAVFLPSSVSGDRKPFANAIEHSGERQLATGRYVPRLYIPEGGTSLEEVERSLITLAMREAEGNQTHAARLLDISRDALRYKLKKFGLSWSSEGGPPISS